MTNGDLYDEYAAEVARETAEVESWSEDDD